MTPRERLESLRQQASLLALADQFTELRPYNGRGESLGLCPFHPESEPSFFVNDRTGRFFCHGCQAGGDVFRFIEILCACSFRDAVQQVARLAKGKPVSLPIVGLASLPCRCPGIEGGGTPSSASDRLRAARERHRMARLIGAANSVLAREAELPPCMTVETDTTASGQATTEGQPERE